MSGQSAFIDSFEVFNGRAGASTEQFDSCVMTGVSMQ
jgi:hypothetical protein